jgi:hypothetical protein
LSGRPWAPIPIARSTLKKYQGDSTTWVPKRRVRKTKRLIPGPFRDHSGTIQGTFDGVPLRVVQYCTVLYCTILYYIVLYCTVLYCTTLYCTVLYFIVLYCTVLYCTVTVLYCIVLYFTVLYCTVLYTAVLYSTVQYSTVGRTLQCISWYSSTVGPCNNAVGESQH